MSGFADAMTAAIKRRQEAEGPKTDADRAAADEAKRKAAAEAQKKLGYGSAG